MPTILFCLAIPNFDPFPPFSFLTVGQMATECHNTNLSFSLKILLSFSGFPGGLENTCSQFSRKLFNQFENCLQIMIKVLEIYEKCTS